MSKNSSFSSLYRGHAGKLWTLCTTNGSFLMPTFGSLKKCRKYRCLASWQLIMLYFHNESIFIYQNGMQIQQSGTRYLHAGIRIPQTGIREHNGFWVLQWNTLPGWKYRTEQLFLNVLVSEFLPWLFLQSAKFKSIWLKVLTVFSQLTSKIAHIHTNICIRIVDELTCNIPKKFVQDVVLCIPDINFFVRSGLFLRSL